MANKNAPLVDEKLAVSLFLDSLLKETEELPFSEPELPVREVLYHPVPRAEEPVETKPEPVVVEPREETILPQAPQLQTEDKVVQQSLRPEWSNKPFQALLFKVAGLTLAVPLVELSGVVEWQDNVTEMPGHADHYLGLLQHLNKSVPVIDTARMVLPAEKLFALAGDNPRQRVTRVVMIDNCRWGLACDEVDEVITLKPDDVKWRTNNTRRPWLLGTVIDHMCALIDGDGFSKILETGR